MKEVLNNNNNYKRKYWLAILYINGRKLCLCFLFKGLVKSLYAAGAGTWWPGCSHGDRMGYLLSLISCRLLWLNAGVQREHLTRQLSWAAAQLLVACVCHVYLLDKLVLVLYGFSSIDSCCYFVACFGGVKCQQGFTPGIWHQVYNVLG